MIITKSCTRFSLKLYAKGIVYILSLDVLVKLLNGASHKTVFKYIPFNCSFLIFVIILKCLVNMILTC